MHCITIIEAILMASELDKIKSTITISLGTKNRLREIKGNMSYEEYINYLLRQVKAEPKESNYVELQEIRRKTGVSSYGNYKIIFSYNSYSRSDNFQFDIIIDKVRGEEDIIDFHKLIEIISKGIGKEPKEIEFTIYFKLLTDTIKQEIEPLFKHNGRFEDYFSWHQEFKVLNLPEKSFEEDIMQKLNNYKNGLNYDD
jgi:hypothetical protein